MIFYFKQNINEDVFNLEHYTLDKLASLFVAFFKISFLGNLFLDESGVKDKLFFIHPTKFKITQKPRDTNMCSNEKLIFPEK